MKPKVIIQCLHCRAVLRIPRAVLGQTVGCPGCTGPVPTRAPAESDEDFEVIEELEDAGDDAADDDGPSLVRRRPGADDRSTGEDASDDDGPRLTGRLGKPKGRRGGVAEALREVERDRSDDDEEEDDRRGPKKGARRKKKKRGATDMTPGQWRLLIGGSVAGGLVVIGMMIWAAQALFAVKPPPTIPPDKWLPFEVPDRVRGRVPGPMNHRAVPIETMTMHVYTVDPAGTESSYAISHSEGKLPAHQASVSPEVRLNGACAGMIASIPGAKELKREAIQLGPCPGVQLTLSVKQFRRGKLFARLYYHPVSNQIYQIAVAGGGYELDQENVKWFLDAFEILDDGTPPKAPVQTPAAPANPNDPDYKERLKGRVPVKKAPEAPKPKGEAPPPAKKSPEDDRYKED